MLISLVNTFFITYICTALTCDAYKMLRVLNVQRITNTKCNRILKQYNIMPTIPKVAQDYQEFYSAKTNLESLQEFKLPFNKVFEKIVCGNGDISYLKGDAEFKFISPLEEEDAKRIQDKFDKLEDCIDKEIANTFYYLAKLLDSKEEELKIHFNRFFK